MNKNQQMASDIVRAIGGKDNISNVYHCMTRLRLLLKDKEAADMKAIKDIDGVLGQQVKGGELQIIIGPAVDGVYSALAEQTGVERQAAVDENLDKDLTATAPERLTAKAILNKVLDAVSACFSPIITILIVMGVFNLVAILLGPNFLNVIAENSILYTNFYYVGQAIVYFLPMFLAYTASRYFKANTLITMVIAAFMLYPTYLELIAAEGATYSYLGISVNLINYSSSILPMLLIPWVQSYVEKWFNKYCPDVVKVIVVPSLTVLVMMPLSLCLLGPVATYIGNGLNAILVWLYSVAGPLETTLVGAVAIIGVALGFMRPIYFTGLMAFMSSGVDYTVLPMLAVISNFTAMGATIGYMIQIASKDKKKFALTCFISNLLGGVSEPAIFGIFMVEKTLLLTTAVGGAAAGLVQGILKLGYFQKGTSNVFGILSFVSADGPGNLIKGIIVCAVAFVFTMLLTIVMLKRKTSNEK